MNNKPIPADDGVTLDLSSIAAELRTEPAYLRDGHTARTLIRAADLRVILIAIQEGKTLAEHRTEVTASLQVLSGSIRLQLPDGALEGREGQLLVLGPGLAHDVHGVTESAFLLTLGWPAKP